MFGSIKKHTSNTRVEQATKSCARFIIKILSVSVHTLDKTKNTMFAYMETLAEKNKI